jgi:hypothetical protein
MSQKTIHPTTHSIERFEQRVLPHVPENSRVRLKKRESIRQNLYNLVRRTKFAHDANQLIHLQTFFIVSGNPPIPLTLVIDPVKRTLCTLYISPGWQNVGNEESPRWVCF